MPRALRIELPRDPDRVNPILLEPISGTYMSRDHGHYYDCCNCNIATIRFIQMAYRQRYFPQLKVKMKIKTLNINIIQWESVLVSTVRTKLLIWYISNSLQKRIFVAQIAMDFSINFYLMIF